MDWLGVEPTDNAKREQLLIKGENSDVNADAKRTLENYRKSEA